MENMDRALIEATEKRQAAAMAVKAARGRKDGTVRTKQKDFERATAEQLRVENDLRDENELGRT